MARGRPGTGGSLPLRCWRLVAFVGGRCDEGYGVRSRGGLQSWQGAGCGWDQKQRLRQRKRKEGEKDSFGEKGDGVDQLKMMGYMLACSRCV